MAAFIIIVGIVGLCGAKLKKKMMKEKPNDLIAKYMNHVEKREYDEMFSMIENSTNIKKDEFIERNSKIYEGIEISNVKLCNIAIKNKKGKNVTISYDTSCDTIAGGIHFENEAVFMDSGNGYKLLWQDSLIFPDLLSSDKVRVSISQAERGEILDRNGKILAGKGTATSVGIIPGKFEDKERALERLADLLETDVETIENKLAADWVKEDSFVPVAAIPKVSVLDLTAYQPDESVLEEYERQKQMLEIPGVMTTDVEIRSYGLGEAAAHLIGYVQAVTAEDLENHPGEGYNANSVIGRTGMEGLFEKELKGKDGCEISIVDREGNIKKTLASVLKENGTDIQLTIDYDLQKLLYEQFKEDRGCSVAMNPYSGEVLALVSTPSLDNNDFIKGMSSEKWAALKS